jgi:hypothetical protein
MIGSGLRTSNIAFNAPPSSPTMFFLYGHPIDKHGTGIHGWGTQLLERRRLHLR